MGLVKEAQKSMKFEEFVFFSKKNGIHSLEFPIDYFCKIENKKLDYYFKILASNQINTIIDLEDLNFTTLKKLADISKEFKFNIIRVKMSNFFGGNRYLIKNFYKIKNKFINDLKKSIKIIDKTDLRFAIENHQDLNSKELVDILRNTSITKVGINWDIANSLATIETPDEFFNTTKKYILNVHSKDYKVINSNNGFFLKRCVIGTGIVKFKNYIDFFKKNKINFSIELGAHISRHCDFKNNKFIRSHNLSKKRIRKFEKFLDKEKVDENPYTNWELNKNLKQAYVEEINDVKASIKFVKKIYEK